MPPPITIRFVLNILAVLSMVVTNATGIFWLSISFAIAAPQRVPVPHVAAKITPSIPSFLRDWAISLPMRLASLRKVPVPFVA